MDNSFEQKNLQELVLYQAIVHRSKTSVHPVAFRERPNCHAGASLRPFELNPGVKHIFEKLQRRIFYHSDWWSVTQAEKGLVINLLI